MIDQRRLAMVVLAVVATVGALAAGLYYGMSESVSIAPTTNYGQQASPVTLGEAVPAAEGEGGDARSQLGRITSGRLGRPAMVELGAEWCPYCRRMTVVIDELRKQYKNRVEFLQIDVEKYPDIASRYKVKSIPVQVFYDTKGRQVARHTGFYPKEDIAKQLSKMGVKG